MGMVQKEVQDKVMGLYGRIKDTFYLCRDDIEVGGHSYNAALLLGVMTELNRGSQLLFGEYGGGKTTSSEYLHCIFNPLPLDLVRRVTLRADPQKTDEKMVARPHYGKLHGQEEEVVWQHFVLIGAKIVDEFNRLPESNQSILLNGVDRGEWSYLNDFIDTEPQPLFATCNYADRGNNSLIPPMLDRFDVSAEVKYCGLANEDMISDDYHNEKDNVLKHRGLTKKILTMLNEGHPYAEVVKRLSEFSEEYSQHLSREGFQTLDDSERTRIDAGIKRVRLDADAQIYFNMLSAELSVTSKFGDKRSNDPIDIEHGRYLSTYFAGSGSRRSAKALKRYARSFAWLQGREEVTLDHMIKIAPHVLWHRMRFTDEVRKQFRDDSRKDPLDLHIIKTLLADGTDQLPGVKKRFVQSRENYQKVLDLVGKGKSDDASRLIAGCFASGKGHPVFSEAGHDLQHAHFVSLAKRVGRDALVTDTTPTQYTLTIEGSITGDSYADALGKIRKLKKVPLQHMDRDGTTLRPLSSKETIEALVADYESSRSLDNLRQGYDTCTVVIGGSRGLKLIPVSDAIVGMDLKNPPKELRGDYETIRCREIPFENGKYDAPLTPEEVMDHMGWLALVEEDIHLLRALRDIVFSVTGKRESMNFMRPQSDGIVRPVFMNNVYNDLRVVQTDLEKPCRFLRLTK